MEKNLQINTLEGVLAQAVMNVRPQEKLDIAECAAKHRYMHNPPLPVKLWDHNDTPYLKLPMQLMSSDNYTSIIFVGPAQCGKTELFLNLYLWIALYEPLNIKLVQTIQETARDFSSGKVAELHRLCPIVVEQLQDDRFSDNVMTKKFATGTMVKFCWPTINHLSGFTARMMFLTDFDRMSQDVDKNGNPFYLAQARTTRFGKYAMTVAESSPSYESIDPRWSPSNPHEAPPTIGILSLYNKGDQRQWYWQCENCKNKLEPHWNSIRYLTTGKDAKTGKTFPLTNGEAAKTVWLECKCGAKYYEDGKPRNLEDPQYPSKYEMNIKGVWLKPDQSIDIEGNVIGGEEDIDARFQMASFRLNGVAAAFQSWEVLVKDFLDATESYEKNPETEPDLQAFWNVKLGMSYEPKAIAGSRTPDEMKENAVDIGTRVVPEGVRFLIASVDVQIDRFVVQVHGIGYGNNVHVIDRFEITESRRINYESDNDNQLFRLDPFVELEDWKLLFTKVINAKYPLSDGSGRFMEVFHTICDSGGGDKTTAHAYDFYRWLRRGPTQQDKDQSIGADWLPGMHRRFVLYKGRKGSDKTPFVKLEYPHKQKNTKFADAKGEIPIVFGKSNDIKEVMNWMLRKKRAESGAIWFADWLGPDFYKELCAETRNPKGEWVNLKNLRNESWDLLCMMLALMKCEQKVNIDKLNWDAPPRFADEWDKNLYVVSGDRKKPLDKELEKFNISKTLGKEFG